MATRKEKIDIENEKQLSAAPAAEEGQDPASRVPPFTVRIYPLSNPKTKLLATASINIADSFAVKGFRIYDSKNGLFVKDPERRYVKNGTELTDSVFFPITKEARELLHGQILSSYELVMEQQERQHPQQKDELEELLEDDIPFDTAYQSAPLPTDEDAPVMTM
jgi:DNA-binding cell septation regulator SpoVG